MKRKREADRAASKQKLRRKIWRDVEDVVSFPKPITGRIPNFHGQDESSVFLARTDEFRRAKVIKVHPSLNARKLRAQVLETHKLLLVPPLPGYDFLYYAVQHTDVRERNFAWAATKRGFNQLGLPLHLKEIPRIDLIVVGSTVVTKEGCRLGKGKGYGEVEYGILRDLGVVDDNTVVATLVHEKQIVSVEEFPSDYLEPWDLPVDIISTPKRVIYTDGFLPKPKGILWEKISSLMMEDIGALKELKEILRERECSSGTKK